MSDLIELVAFIDGITADWRESRARKRTAKRAFKRSSGGNLVTGDPTLVDAQRAAVYLRKINV
jgi:hypothetical protein